VRTEVCEEAIRVLEIEAQAILALKSRIGADFSKAVDLIFNCQGKLVVTGIGKSGHVARKLSSTFSSTGTPSVFLHPAEGSHGDLGLLGRGDVILALSYSGEAPELADVLKFAARKDIPIIAMSGRQGSQLGTNATIFLDVGISEEACPLGLAPTASSTATLALGDALAMALLRRRGFQESDFAELHPGGSLGRRLLTRVQDVMHQGEQLPVVQATTPMRKVISVMTQKEVRGVAGVVNADGDLIGVVTDGDIRRRLEKSEDPLGGTAKDLMSQHPKTIDAMELAQRALFIMEEFRIQILFVVEKNSASPKKPVGVIHIQDLIRAKVK
jgi:arabinose-5-phosphate isomerase